MPHSKIYISADNLMIRQMVRISRLSAQFSSCAVKEILSFETEQLRTEDRDRGVAKSLTQAARPSHAR